VNALIDLFRSIQPEGSILGLDFWSPSVAKSPVFLRMKNFFTEHFGMKNSEYTFIDEKWIETIEGYEPIDLTTVIEKETSYAGSRRLQDNTNMLLESYAVLKRK
jgi:hypothetical protein